MKNNSSADVLESEGDNMNEIDGTERIEKLSKIIDVLVEKTNTKIIKKMKNKPMVDFIGLIKEENIYILVDYPKFYLDEIKIFFFKEEPQWSDEDYCDFLLTVYKSGFFIVSDYKKVGLEKALEVLKKIITFNLTESNIGYLDL